MRELVPTIRPIRSSEELDMCFQQAKDNGHSLVYPSLLVENNGDLLGTVSIIPSAWVWMDTRKAAVRDSVHVQKFLDNHVASNGGRVICIPCTKDSPFHPLMPKFGFTNCGDITMFVKGI